jgi:hypothetical protein
MDVGVVLDSLPEALIKTINTALPEGITVMEIYSPQRKFSEIAWVGISVKLHYEKRSASCIKEELSKRFAAESIVISKKTKSGTADIDIAPLIWEIGFTGYDIIVLDAKISAHNPTLKPDDILNALDGEYIELKPDYAEMTRFELYDRHKVLFR